MILVDTSIWIEFFKRKEPIRNSDFFSISSEWVVLGSSKITDNRKDVSIKSFKRDPLSFHPTFFEILPRT